MKKESLIWLIVRLIGCVFGYWAVTSSLVFVGSLYLLLQAPILNQFVMLVFVQGSYIAIYFAGAAYFIRDGRLLFDVLNAEDEPGNGRPSVIQTSLHLSDE